MALGGAGSGGGSAGGVRMGRAYVELGAKDTLSGHLKSLAGKFANFGKMILGATGIGGLVGGVLGGLGFKETADDLSKMNDVAKAFGISGKQASGLFGALGAAGGEFKENLEGVIQFSDTLQQAVRGGDNQGAKLFEGLAITAKELEGLSVDEQFYRVHDAIRQLPQPLQEAKLALLGGSDSMKQWQKLLGMSNEELRASAEAAAISSDELKQAAEASKQMQAAGAAVGRVWQQVVIMLAPLVAQVAKGIADALAPVIAWLKGRNLKDLWDSAVAWFLLGWEEIRQAGLKAWLSIAGWFTDAWYDMEAVGKLVFIELTEWIEKLMSGEFWAGLVTGFTVQLIAIEKLFRDTLTGMAAEAEKLFTRIVEAVKNPAAAAAELAVAISKESPTKDSVTAAVEDAKEAVEEWNKGNVDAGVGVVLGGREGVLQEALKKKQAAADLRQLELDRGQEGVDAARKRIQDIDDRVAQRKRDSEFGDFLDWWHAGGNGMAGAVAAVGRSLGTFGAGSFLAQGFGVQSAADVGKQMVKEQKKGNGLLQEIANKGPMVFA